MKLQLPEENKDREIKKDVKEGEKKKSDLDRGVMNQNSKAEGHSN